MLKNSFFFIQEKIAALENTVEYSIRFDLNHPVFKGHFPGNPVVPGVFLIQLIQELTEDMTGDKLRLVAAKKIKFLSVINPQSGNQISAQLTIKPEVNEYSIDAVAYFSEQTCLKINARFAKEL